MINEIIEYFKNNKVLDGYFRFVEHKELNEYIDCSFFEIDECSAFAISVFGEVLIIEDNEFVSIINFPLNDCNTISHVYTFLEQLKDEEFINDWFNIALYNEAKEKYDDVNESQIYGFVPLLCLGGSVNVNNLDKCDWKVHLHLIQSFLM